MCRALFIERAVLSPFYWFTGLAWGMQFLAQRNGEGDYQMTPNTVQDGLVVSIHYTLTLDDGEVVDESTADDPLLYLHGADNIIPGLEKALTGMAVNDSKRVTVSPEDGYGEYDEEAVEALPRNLFPDDMELEPGIVLGLRDEDGNVFDAVVVEELEEEVVLDFNHPLAGENLHFDVKVVSIRQPTAEELDHGHPHMPGHEH
jgi:FKBP-type peptidyl-prolyl cis-trans isomerase SlyD